MSLRENVSLRVCQKCVTQGMSTVFIRNLHCRVRQQNWYRPQNRDIFHIRFPGQNRIWGKSGKGARVAFQLWGKRLKGF